MTRTFAVSLYFDSQSEERLQKMIRGVAEKCGNNYMASKKIRPHLSICLIKAELGEGAAQVGAADTAVVAQFRKAAKRIKRGKICFASVGAFAPCVLFVAPVMNDFLKNANEVANKFMLKAGSAGERGNYLPNRWVPHTTIATKLDSAALACAFESLSTNFAAFDCQVEQIALAECNPYCEIAFVELGNRSN